MVSLREAQLFKSWNLLKKRKIISMNELDDLMSQIDKVLMELKRVRDSRENWKLKYEELKNGD